MLPPDFHPRKSLGQNFLTNHALVEKITASAEIKPETVVVEVGPGMGILTEKLLAKAAHVIAVEKDGQLFEFLQKKFAEKIADGKLELIHDDALEIPPPTGPFMFVANIPYSITSPLLDHFIRDNPANLPQRAVVLVQKEVAEKLCAKPPRMNVLALHIQTFGAAKLVMNVSRNNFSPRPKVDSAVVRVDFPNPQTEKHFPKSFDYENYFATIHKAFSHKRKMLRGIFEPEFLEKAGIDGTRRAETLTLDEWVRLN